MEQDAWINEPSPELDDKGFVYKITNLDTGEYYIGYKTFWNIRKRKQKGRKRRKTYASESNWRNYWGSSGTDVIGKDKNCIREVLEVYKSRSLLRIGEVRRIIETMEDPLCLNRVIQIRTTIPKKLTLQPQGEE